MVQAAILLIGDELLSGRTRDINLQNIAQYLAPIGIQVAECRVIPDDLDTIIQSVNQLRSTYDYLLTTGGIGPTHDDITAEAIAKAFDVSLEINDEAKERLLARYGDRLNASRLRMARIPAGARLIDNPVSVAPGIHIENVFVLAGVPEIATAMLDDVGPYLEGGDILYADTIALEAVVEGDVAAILSQLQDEFPQTSIGSYPYYRSPSDHGTQIVVRTTDKNMIHAVKEKILVSLA